VSTLSVNEPQDERPMLTPQSINEPASLPVAPGAPAHPVGGLPTQLDTGAAEGGPDFEDPDELEDELEQSEAEGDFKPLHRDLPKRRK
jgi:hypothetical protein